MGKRTYKTMIIITATSFLIGMTSLTASAGTSETGAEEQAAVTSHHRGEMHETGKNQRSDRRMTANSTLTDEQREKLQSERDAFETATRDLRTELQSKRLALQSELVKKDPDAETAKSLQGEISALNAELAQKRIEHILMMKEIVPGAAAGMMHRHSRERATGGDTSDT